MRAGTFTLIRREAELGWIVNIVASVIGGFVAASFGSMAMEMILPLLDPEGSLAFSQHPLLYILSAGMRSEKCQEAKSHFRFNERSRQLRRPQI